MTDAARRTCYPGDTMNDDQRSEGDGIQAMQQGTVRARRGWLRGVTAALAALLLAAGCGGAVSTPASANVIAALSGPADTGYARAAAPMTFSFPRDHGAHPDYRTEWWYYTGNLVDPAGDEYGFQFTIFRSALSPQAAARASDLATNQVYMAHFAVTDVARDRHVSFERFSRGSGGLAGATGEPVFSVWLEDWSAMQAAPDVMHLTAQATTAEGETVAIDLQVAATRPVMLQGNAGLSQKGPEAGNASYYYSLVGLATTGSVTAGGRTVAVTGQSWMDHEFGTSALSADAVGWDWFSLQLDGGEALMFAQIRTADGRAVGDFQGALMAADGAQQALAASALTLAVTDEWTSPRTGIVYPSGWRVTIPDHGLALTVTPLVRDQEMQVSYRYWEGAVAVSGTAHGEPVSGRGYVELTGYGDPDAAGRGYQR